jgi:hypothetical protein
VTRADLLRALLLHGYGLQFQLDDETYSPISVEFVREAHAAWLESLPPALRTVREIGGGKSVPAVRWEAESGDCDNIARDFAAFLSRCMWAAAVAQRRPRGNIAAGKFNFQPTPDTGHAVNWFVDHEGRPHHFDAATEQFDHLTRDQLATLFAGESC